MKIVAGLSNGHAAVISATIDSENIRDAVFNDELDLGSDAGKGPVTCGALSGDAKTLWLAHGQKVTAFSLPRMERITSWTGGHQSDFSRGVIRHIVALARGSGGSVLCTSAQRSDSVRFWNKEGKLVSELHCSSTFPDEKEKACQVTYLHADGHILWVGTRSGHALLYDLHSHKLLATCHHHGYVHWIGSINADDESHHKHAQCSVLICGNPKQEQGVAETTDTKTSSPGGSVFVRVDWMPS